jgi:hypothetical protein
MTFHVMHIIANATAHSIILHTCRVIIERSFVRGTLYRQSDGAIGKLIDFPDTRSRGRIMLDDIVGTNEFSRKRA